jgi:cell division protein FtsB
MKSNARRQTNVLHWASLCRWVVISAFFGAAGLSYVYLKNQLHVSGIQRKGLEQDLHELIAENNVMEAQIARLKSHTALQRRLQEGFIKLVPITEHSLVLIRPQTSARWVTTAGSASEGQLRTISHEPAAP